MRLLWQNGIDLNRVIYLNHYQDTWLAESFPGLLAHMFGRIHTFSVTLGKGALSDQRVGAGSDGYSLSKRAANC